MKLWIARDKSGNLHAFVRQPNKDEGAFWISGTNRTLLLPKNEFSKITWENSPQEIELKLKEE